MELEIESLSQKHGLMLVTDDPDFLHCCMKCEVASSLGSVEACPQRVHTSNSCCPSCSLFLEHGLEAMLSHWKEGQFFASFQIVIPLKIDEDMIRSVFKLYKVPVNQLRILYEWKDYGTLDIVFERHLDWVMTIRHTYWPLDLLQPFLREPLIFGLAGFPDRAGATVFSQLQKLVEDFKTWLIENYEIDLKDFFPDEVNHTNQNSYSYFVSYFLRFENAENLSLYILAPDYGRSEDPEICLLRMGDNQVPVISFEKVNEALVMQKGVLASWQKVEPELQGMLEDLSSMTTEMRTTQATTVSQLTELLDRIQTIQERFFKLKPEISTMQGHISPFVPLLSEPLIRKLFPSFNLSLVNSWIDFARSVERSVEGANSYIQGKMNLLALDQEKKTNRRLNLLTALFGCLSGLGLLVSVLAWYDPHPSELTLILTGILIVSLTALTLIFVGRVVKD